MGIDQTSTNPHFEEYFRNVQQSSEERLGKEIFKADKDNTDVKTDLNTTEIYHINALKMLDNEFKRFGFESIYNLFYDDYMRLKISKDRQSRGEFVKVSSSDKSDNIIEGAKTFGTLFNGGVTSNK